MTLIRCILRHQHHFHVIKEPTLPILIVYITLTDRHIKMRQMGIDSISSVQSMLRSQAHMRTTLKSPAREEAARLGNYMYNTAAKGKNEPSFSQLYIGMPPGAHSSWQISAPLALYAVSSCLHEGANCVIMSHPAAVPMVRAPINKAGNLTQRRPPPRYPTLGASGGGSRWCTRFITSFSS